MQIRFDQIDIPPGQRIILRGIDWEHFQTLLKETGEHRVPRYAYHQGNLEIMSPLAEHEYAKCLIADMVAILLEEMDREFIALGSTTLKNDHAEQAVEPDECFYIRHEAEVRGKSRIDLNTDPPPDLALEIDLTSRTHFRHYAALGIPELWRYEGQKLEILVLRQGVYQSAEHSMLFPEFDLKGTVPEVLRQCQLLGRNRALKTFRQGVRSQLARGGSVTP